MTANTATRILELLAQGVHPETGEILDRDGVLNSPSVIRALFLGAHALASKPVKSRATYDVPSHAGKPWTPEEEERLIAEFDAETPIDKLARSHGRSKGGIAARLARPGKIDERSDVYVRESRTSEPLRLGESGGAESVA